MNEMQQCLSSITLKLATPRATPATQATATSDEKPGMVLETDEMHEKVEAGHDTNPDHIETVCVEIINDDEDSFASADETVPDIPSPSRNLNLSALTTQL